jgi:hypothetical protein
MQPEQVQYIRDRLTDWEAVPKACMPTIRAFGGDPQMSTIQVTEPSGRRLWSSDELVRTARHLQVLVDTCEASLSRPEGDPDRAWAVTVLSGLLLIWADQPDYPKART